MAASANDLSAEAVTAWARLLRSGQAMLAAADAELKANDLPPLVWYDALLELKRAGKEGMRPYRLQREMLLAQYNLSRLVDRMQAEGLVARRPCPEDARGHVLVITPDGEKMLKKMWPVYRSVIRRALADRLDAPSVARLAGILGRLLDPPP